MKVRFLPNHGRMICQMVVKVVRFHLLVDKKFRGIVFNGSTSGLDPFSEGSNPSSATI